MARPPRYRVGIDLGTTHTVVAYADSRDRNSAIELFPIEQLVAPGEVAARPLLPSLRYHPTLEELPAGDRQLPWPEPDLGEPLPAGIIGELARELGSRVPGRLVASAKSWLSHAAVDRTAAILPWGADPSVGKISPLAASASYLAHIRAAWDLHFPDHPLADQDLILTLPASFDEDARALTVAAARLAGLERVHLLEEPQAACYAWLADHRGQLAMALGDSRLLLVVDVGGGTTDLTLIRIDPGKSEPRLTRIAVGNHLMLGGDNMDLAIAHRIEQRLSQDRLATGQLAQLVQQCRSAKERLLAEDAPEAVTVTLLGGGGRLVGGARSAELSRAEVLELADGFLPLTGIDQHPQRRRGALVEFGLPYAADPAISRHLAAFLQRHAESARAALGLPDGTTPVPDAVLLNGGVFHAHALRRRLLELLGHWRGAPLQLLDTPHPDRAVAHGAVAYSLARGGHGVRIGGGMARSVFLLADGEQQQAVCLLPRGSEEGQELRLPERQFMLRLGQPVRFHLATASADQRYRPGQLITADSEHLVPLPPLASVVSGQGEVAVELASRLTEVGTLAVDCVSVDSPSRRWQLEFQLRGKTRQVADTTQLPAGFEGAAERLQQFYGGRSGRVDPKGVKTLRSDLEKRLGKRDQWDTALLRALFGVLLEGARRRRRSADHERQWFNLTGFCLRPGYGYPLDDWRIGQLWPLYQQGVQYVKDAQNWAEWWTLWRRVAGGLDSAAQEQIMAELTPYLLPPSRQARIKGTRKLGYDDMVRLAASLERLGPARKSDLGGWLLERLGNKGESVQTWQALGRLGTRVPLYGSAHNVVPRVIAADWLQRVLQLDWKKVQPAAFAAVSLARLSGDRERDLDSGLRRQVVARLRGARVSDHWVSLIEEVSELDEADHKRLYGDALPVGLTLVS